MIILDVDIDHDHHDIDNGSSLMLMLTIAQDARTSGTTPASRSFTRAPTIPIEREEAAHAGMYSFLRPNLAIKPEERAVPRTRTSAELTATV